MLMNKPIRSGESGGKVASPDALRNSLGLKWVEAHWNEIEAASLEEHAELERKKRAWIDAEMAKMPTA